MSYQPFQEECEMNKNLELRSTQASMPPDQKSYASIRHIDTNPTALPSQPLSGLDPTDVCAYLCNELPTNDLNRMAPYLWLVGYPAEQSHFSPSPADFQSEIVITENTELHCTWICDRVFIKPNPPFLLSWAFRQHFLVLPSSPIAPSLRMSLHEAAPRYLRTYSRPSKHASDVRIAK